jgi:acyl-CoA synthetase (AMP-forming)/AMP-acid ligase II
VLLHDLVADAARRAPDDLALVTDVGSCTFAVLDASVRAVARGLADVAGPGDRVAILSENRAEYVECYSAVPLAGCVLVPLNHRLHPEEWTSALVRSGAKVLIAESELLARLGPTRARAAGVETIVGLDSPGGDHEHHDADDIQYEQLRGATAIDPARPSAPDDVAWLVGTSGTTGSPKLAELTHAGLLAAVDSTLAGRPVGPADTLLTPFPLCHVAGYNVLVLHRRARPVVLMRRFDPARLATLVREHSVTMLSLAPTMISMLLDSPAVDDADLSTIRALGYGASPIPAPVLRATDTRWDWYLSQGYGMTELSGNAVFLGPD